MVTHTSIAIVCLILFAWNQMSNGLVCYSCSNCNDPFNPTYIAVSYINDTTPFYCLKTSVGFNVTRTILASCTSYGTIGNGQWCCQTNLCNNAKRNMLTNTFCFIIGILMLIMCL